MGPVNWLAALLGASIAVAVGIVWHGPLFRSGRPLLEGVGPEGRPAPRNYLLVWVGFLIGSTMIGHNFARIGPETLAAKPWLYWMMSGGLALTIAAPALFIGLARHGVALRERLLECGYWIVAFLAIGTTFWALA